MDFDACVGLLAARPADAHAHCDHAHHEEEKAEQQRPQEERECAAAVPDGEREVGAGESASELVRAFFRLQEQRVRIYAEFQRGFSAHKKTPAFQAFSITQRFAAVSEGINRVEQTLKADKQRPEVAQLIRRVQLEEKDKLLLTSAVLIERMRHEDAVSAEEPDESAAAFLERSVATLTRKLADCVERINEQLDELRIQAAELDEAEGEDGGASDE